VLAVFAFLSQLLALIRDRALAHQFGAGIELDIYYAAFRIPDLLYVLFASSLSVYVLIPLVAERISGTDSNRARHLLAQVATVFLIGYSALAVGVWVAAPYLVPFIAPGLVDQSPDVVSVLRVLLLQPLLLGISSLLGVVTQLGYRFVLYAVSPLLYNLGIILGIVALYPYFGLEGVAMGVVLGAFGHALVQWPFVRGSDLSFSFTPNVNWSTIKEVLAVSIPRALTLSIHQLVLLVMVAVASLMTVGSVAVFQFAYNLQSVPLAIIGASYSIAAFPLLADLYTKSEFTKFRSYIMTAVRHIIFWSLPVIALIVVLRAQMVRVILGSGAFDWSDTKLVAAVLAMLALSLCAQALNLLSIRAFYAAGDTRTPLIASLGTA
jgi:putative peptidoglycan lipid II flippase